MSKLVSEVLPHHVENNREVETHSAGTLIEAAVYMVNQMAGGPQAIKQLARWFVWHAVHKRRHGRHHRESERAHHRAQR